ncbi:MAG: hypothetical protein JNK56_33100 [Myxococcales bacterium]|nr:hypothetical protein [Myxococcales bacterium]
MVEPAVLPGLRSFAELWVLIDASMPDPERFAAAVAELKEDALIERYADVFTARQRVRVKWAGPFIDAAIGHLSEDSTEDLCDWIVGQGSAIWAAACGAADATLVALFHEAHAERARPGRWRGRTPAIGPALFNAHARHCDGDEFHDRVAEVLAIRAEEEEDDDDDD